MSHSPRRYAPQLTIAALLLFPVVVTPSSAATEAAPAKDIGIERAGLSPVVTNPYLPLSTLKRAVYVGKERDPETGKASRVRMELQVRDTAETLVGIQATVVDVTHYADDEVVERTRDYFAQHESGAVHYIGERVDDYDGGKIVGHDGQWVAGENGSKAGLFMPASPKAGDVFEQECAPGIVQNRSKVLGVARTVKVPAGVFKDCIETEHYDPIEKVTQRKWYCPGVGMVKESSAERTIELTQRENR